MFKLKKIIISSILKLQLFQRQVLNRQKLNFMAKMFVLSIVYEKKSAESILFCLAFNCFQKYFLTSCHSQIQFWKSNNLDLDFTKKAFRKGVWFYCTMKIKRMVILWFFRVINKISRNFLTVTAKRCRLNFQSLDLQTHSQISVGWNFTLYLSNFLVKFQKWWDLILVLPFDSNFLEKWLFVLFCFLFWRRGGKFKFLASDWLLAKL